MCQHREEVVTEKNPKRKKTQQKKTSRRHRIILYYNVKQIVHDDTVNIKFDMEEIQRM